MTVVRVVLTVSAFFCVVGGPVGLGLDAPRAGRTAGVALVVVGLLTWVLVVCCAARAEGPGS